MVLTEWNEVTGERGLGWGRSGTPLSQYWFSLSLNPGEFIPVSWSGLVPELVRGGRQGPSSRPLRNLQDKTT